MDNQQVMTQLDKTLLVDTIIQQQQQINHLKKDLEFQQSVARSNLKALRKEQARCQSLKADRCWWRRDPNWEDWGFVYIPGCLTDGKQLLFDLGDSKLSECSYKHCPACGLEIAEVPND